MGLELDSLDGRLQLRGLLGEGGMGQVYRAWDAALQRAVAVKLVRSHDPRDAERLLLEARLQARVDHAHVVKVHEVGTLGGRPCIVLQLIEGRTLARLAGELPIPERVELLRQAATGVHAAHVQGLVHRDVKPGNVLVDEAQGARRALVSDFGLARGEEPGLTQTGLPPGTLDFMSPEQLAGTGPADLRSDVYALGATLYAVLAGQPPFRTPAAPADDDVRLVRRILEDDPARLRRAAGVPPELDVIAARAMEKDPAARYPSAEAFGEDLGRFLRGEPILARPATPLARARKWARRNPSASRALALAAVALLAAGTWTAWRARRENLQALDASRYSAEAQAMADAMRMEYLAPPHDVSPARARIREQLDALRPAAAAGSPAAHLALGQALELLGDLPGARAAYERAWALGLQSGEVAAGLGSVLSQLYLREARTAGRSFLPEARARRVEALRAELADPARRYFERGDTGGWRGPLLRARAALLDGDFVGVRALAAQVLAADPQRYEARVLEAEAWLAEGVVRLDVDQRVAAAEAAFHRAVPPLEEALWWGRSDPGTLELLARAHRSLSDAIESRGRDPLPSAREALSWADRAAAVDPQAPGPLLDRGAALEVLGRHANSSSSDASQASFEQAAEAYRRAATLAPADAAPRYALLYNAYARAFVALWAGKPVQAFVEEGLRAAAEGAALAPDDISLLHDSMLLREVQAEALQHEGRDATEPIRAALALGQELLGRTGMHVSFAKETQAQVYLLLAREDWVGGRDPREDVARSIRLAEEARAAKSGQPVGAQRVAVALGQGAELLLALGDDPRGELARCLEAVRGVAGSSKFEVLRGEALSIEARRRLQAGEDPTEAAAESERILRPVKAAIGRRNVGEYLGQAVLAAAAWAVARGGDPSAPLRRAEADFEDLLRGEPRNGLGLEGLAACALQRALWLRRRGHPAEEEARRGLAPAARALEVDARDPVRWVLQARLQVLAGDAAAARRSLERAVAVNTLVRGNPGYRMAEAELGGP